MEDEWIGKRAWPTKGHLGDRKRDGIIHYFVELAGRLLFLIMP